MELAIFQCAVHSIAEEMGAALRRTALSPNIKERRDYSCAVFDGRGRAIAMGDHMPVHLGSMPMSVQAAIAAIEFAPGDIAILNDPYAGGTHLPDITMVLPVFFEDRNAPVFYVANRAHHADVGGKFAGSMGPATTIEDEGIRISPVRIVRGGAVDREVLDWILRSVRTPARARGRPGRADGRVPRGRAARAATGREVRHGEAGGMGRGAARLLGAAGAG